MKNFPNFDFILLTDDQLSPFLNAIENKTIKTKSQQHGEVMPEDASNENLNSVNQILAEESVENNPALESALAVYEPLIWRENFSVSVDRSIGIDTDAFNLPIYNTVTSIGNGEDKRVVQTPPNLAPIGVNDFVTISEDNSVTINVLANDSDSNGDTLTVVGVTAGMNGMVIINVNNTVSYTPDINFNGSDGFSYFISDGKAISKASVSITVEAVNDAPEA